jgi:hypothetical protein
MHVPFFLDDNTAKVMVDPRGAELDLHRDFQQEFCDSFFTTKEEVPPNVRALLSRHGIETRNKIKVEEFCIKPKNSLFLLGTLGENPGLELTPKPIRDDEHNTLTFDKALWFNPGRSAFGTSLSIAGGAAFSEHSSVSELLIGGGSTVPHSEFHESAFANSPLGKSIHAEESGHAASSRIIQLSPDSVPTKLADMTQQQKIAAALMKAGISNPAAWAAAGVPSSMPAVGASQTSALVAPAGSTEGFDPRPPIVLMKGKNNSTFLISWRSQRELARSLGWRCSLMIWGGPILALLCLYGLLTLTHLI